MSSMLEIHIASLTPGTSSIASRSFSTSRAGIPSTTSIAVAALWKVSSRTACPCEESSSSGR